MTTLKTCEVRLADGVGGSSAVNRGLYATTAYQRLKILERYKRIAMVGLSSNPFRPSHFAAIYMLAEGYDVVGVNPRETQVLGRDPRGPRSLGEIGACDPSPLLPGN